MLMPKRASRKTKTPSYKRTVAQSQGHVGEVGLLVGGPPPKLLRTAKSQPSFDAAYVYGINSQRPLRGRVVHVCERGRVK